MGVKLLILLALVLGVLYTVHLLVKDYQALTAPRLLRLLLKRDLHAPRTEHNRPYVRWKRVLQHDVATCVRALYCGLGSAPPPLPTSSPHSDLHAGLLYMLTVPPRDEERASLEVFKQAVEVGTRGRSSAREPDIARDTARDTVRDSARDTTPDTARACRRTFPRCPFSTETLLDLVQFVLDHRLF